MARGITESDVWNACDALLLEGGRPTIERVRQKIGSGSPNTVSPFLDTWFRHLGGRIKDPGAFAAPPGVPDAISQAAKHFWEAALSETRRDFDERLRDGMAAAIANVEAEKERSAQSDAAAFEATSRLTHLQTLFADQLALLEKERLTLAIAQADLANARLSTQDLESRLKRCEEIVSTERTQHRDALGAATERSDAATRRAALEIEQERQARAGAEKRLAASQVRLEAVRAELLEERAQTVAANERLGEQRRDAARELEQAQGGIALDAAKNEELRAALTQAVSRADRAEAEAELAKTLLSRLEPKTKTKSAMARSGGP